jgi:hypothetical protein
MDLLFDCPACTGPLVADDSGRGVLSYCAHCGAAVSIPDKARAARTLALTMISDASGDGPPPRLIRRVRPASRQLARPLIAASARITPIPQLVPSAWRAA